MRLPSASYLCNTCYFQLLTFCHSGEYVVVFFTEVLIGISLTGKGFSTAFYMFTGHLGVLFYEMPNQAFCHFLYGDC